MAEKTWTKRLTVDKRIVSLLSARTYEDFPGALREMVSNAYDADASRIDIQIDLKNDTIRIQDNGNGMTSDQFDFFLRIAGKQRGRRRSPIFDRKRIGIFGIGFLSIFPFASEITISSSTRKSDERFEAFIPAEAFVKEDEGIVDIEDINISGMQLFDPSFTNQHGTTITLRKLSDFVKRYYAPRDSKIRSERNTIKKWSPDEQLKWTLEEDLPLDYDPNRVEHPPFQDLGPTGMNVFLNDEQLFRKLSATDILENDVWSYGDIKCRFFVATNWKSIKLDEERYFKIRLNNVGIGSRQSFGVGTVGRAYSRLHWLTGEIRIVSGFDNLLAIDREKFSAGPDYDVFSEYFRGRLVHWANKVETISEADRDIKRQLSSSKIAEVGSKRNVIQRNVKKLESQGFKVIDRNDSSRAKGSPPVKVNTRKRTVEVQIDHPDLSDTEQILGNEVIVEYEKWSIDTADFAAIRRNSDGAIQINTEYPLFQQQRYGETLKKILLLLFLLAEETEGPLDLVQKLMHQLPGELNK